MEKFAARADTASMFLGLLFLGEFTAVETSNASMTSDGYGFNTARASSTDPESQASWSSRFKMAGMRWVLPPLLCTKRMRSFADKVI
jgi:hypothetical protein